MPDVMFTNICQYHSVLKVYKLLIYSIDLIDTNYYQQLQYMYIHLGISLNHILSTQNINKLTV
jgi:hypothetical protein